ncbi:MAG: ribokinase [Chloroflexota bacterium]
MSVDGRIVVVGSVNMDLVVRVPRIPVPGETILGDSLVEYPGGKGANQAVAAARLNGAPSMVGCVGRDAYAKDLRGALTASGVETTFLLERGPRSGIAVIEVASSGENNIVVVQGANALLVGDDVDDALTALTNARIVLLQLEVPLATVEYGALTAHAKGLLVLLDPAPAQMLSDSLLSAVDYLTPNQQEAALLTGMSEVGPDEAPEAARRLLARGVKTAIVKLGADGVYAANTRESFRLPGHRVDTVDTTAAGDCLSGALAAALVEGRPLRSAVAFANAAAALSTTRRGAQPSMPTTAEVEELLLHSEA